MSSHADARGIGFRRRIEPLQGALDGATERKRVTIVCADVAGYSRLIRLDEEGTVARLRVHH